MNLVQIVLGILFFAIISAFLYVWGLKKSMRQREDLMRMLDNRASQKILRALKKKERLTLLEIESLMKGVTASEFYSKKRAVIQDQKSFAKRLTASLCEKGLLLRHEEGTSVYFTSAEKTDIKSNG